ncbi:4a-hydroxytetrahydrobiopterin dehydratase [Mariniphaga sp.]|uniref:4a-hydroxytetrahydrobiopterin dehydratase n=1 Tax=Mariniphaga sp. TaxID=1954475 RepID=UPI0035612ECF
MNWETENNKLVKEFKLENFEDAVSFVNQIMPLAEASDHHPDVLIHSYKKVKVMLFTHSEGKITEKDYNLAKQIDAVFSSR